MGRKSLASILRFSISGSHRGASIGVLLASLVLDLGALVAAATQ